MILSEKTLQKFGYLPTDLTHASTKLIIIQCDFCLSEFTRKQVQLSKPSRSAPHACPNCDQIKSNWIRNNPQKLSPINYYQQYWKPPDEFIDQQLTKEAFGYQIADLGPKSEKPIIVNCIFCSITFQSNLSNLARSEPVCHQCTYLFKQWDPNTDPNEFWKNHKIEVNWNCININETINQFHYDPRQVSPLSEKKIVAICCRCHQSTVISRFAFLTKKDFLIACPTCIPQVTKETLIKKYGVANTLSIPAVQEKLKNPSTEIIIESLLRNHYQIDFIRNHNLGPYSFDFFLPTLNLLIECQGDYFHQFKENGYEGTPKDKAKTTYIETYTNHKLIWIWEHELHIGRLRKILDYHIHSINEPTLEINKQQLYFKPITHQAGFEFLSNYHYLGNLGTAASTYGAYYEDQLVVVAVFGGTTRQGSLRKISKELNLNINEIRELRRFCIKPNVVCKNLASFSLKKFLSLYQKDRPEIEAIISFSDLNVGDIGTIYKASNWKRLSNTSKSYHYLDPLTLKPIHKRVLYNLAVAAKMTESEFVMKTNLIKVTETEKELWIKFI